MCGGLRAGRPTSQSEGTGHWVLGRLELGCSQGGGAPKWGPEAEGSRPFVFVSGRGACRR